MSDFAGLGHLSALAAFVGLQAVVASRAPAKDLAYERCWRPVDEAENDDRIFGSFPRLPPELRQERVSKGVVSFKLCINSAGAVASALTRVSSGNKKVDDFFRKSLLKWKYRPRRISSENRPSIAFVTVTLALLSDEP